MSDFKFACPDCDQHVRCDEALGGHRVKCPGCGIDLVIPQPRPGANDELVMAVKLSTLDHDPSRPTPRPPSPSATPAPQKRVQAPPATPAPPSAESQKPGSTPPARSEGSTPDQSQKSPPPAAPASPVGTSTSKDESGEESGFAGKRALQESQPRPNRPLNIPAAAKFTEPATEQIARDKKDSVEKQSGDTSPPAGAGTGSASQTPAVKPMPSIKLNDTPVARPQADRPKDKESTSTNPPRVRILPKPGEPTKGDASKD